MENKFDKTSLDQAIENNQSTAPSIDIMQSYALLKNYLILLSMMHI